MRSTTKVKLMVVVTSYFCDLNSGELSDQYVFTFFFNHNL